MTRATQTSWYPTPSHVQQLHLIRAALQWTLLMFHVVCCWQKLIAVLAKQQGHLYYPAVNFLSQQQCIECWLQSMDDLIGTAAPPIAPALDE